MQVIASKWLGEHACGDHPGFTMAEKDQILNVVEVLGEESKWDYVLQDVDKQYPTFFASKEEVNRITKHEAIELLKRELNPRSKKPYFNYSSGYIVHDNKCVELHFNRKKIKTIDIQEIENANN